MQILRNDLLLKCCIRNFYSKHFNDNQLLKIIQISIYFIICEKIPAVLNHTLNMGMPKLVMLVIWNVVYRGISMIYKFKQIRIGQDINLMFWLSVGLLSYQYKY